jgi:hypothetical protein
MPRSAWILVELITPRLAGLGIRLGYGYAKCFKENWRQKVDHSADSAKPEY